MLTHAKHELQWRGWCQHQVIDGAGRVCAFGALTAGIYGYPSEVVSREHYAVVNFLTRVATGLDPDNATGLGLGDWNDDPDRTLQDVLDAFDAAIAIATDEESSALDAGDPSGTDPGTLTPRVANSSSSFSDVEG